MKIASSSSLSSSGSISDPLEFSLLAEDTTSSMLDFSPAHLLVSTTLLLAATLTAPYLLYKLQQYMLLKSSIPFIARYANNILFVAAFLINLFTVQLPGRFDSNASMESKNKTILNFAPIFAPAGWAFAIWGVIYLGEILLSVSVGTNFLYRDYIDKHHITLGWASANIIQSLWCFSFRDTFKKVLWLPTLKLAGAALSQIVALKGVMQVMEEVDASIPEGGNHFFNMKIILGWFISFPIALHAGWLMAASLLNLNTFATESGINLAENIALANISVYLAVSTSLATLYYTRNFFVPLTTAWALAAVASKTKTNSGMNKKNKPHAIDLVTSDSLYITQLWSSRGLLVVAFAFFVSNIVKLF